MRIVGESSAAIDDSYVMINRANREAELWDKYQQAMRKMKEAEELFRVASLDWSDAYASLKTEFRRRTESDTMSKAVVYAWTFASSSSSHHYETLQYEDGSLSCDCPGWTRRVDEHGARSCKHTRTVQLGRGNELSEKHGPIGRSAPVVVAGKSKQSTSAAVVNPSFKRKFV